MQYKLGPVAISFDLDVDHETMWATQEEIGALFEKDKRTISEHIGNVLKSGELEESAVVRNFRTTGSDGKSYEMLHYNLDMILSVGLSDHLASSKAE